MSVNYVVSITTRLRAKNLRNRSSSAAKGKRFVIVRNVQADFWLIQPRAQLVMGGLFLRGKCDRRVKLDIHL